MATPRLSTSIQQFRQDVLARGGPQIASRYKVDFYIGGASLTTYPFSVIIPGRSMVFYEHDIWGPTRKIPVKRTYTQCQISFIVYQDWTERRFIENWMNYLVKNDGFGTSPSPAFIGGDGSNLPSNGLPSAEDVQELRDNKLAERVYNSELSYRLAEVEIDNSINNDIEKQQLEITNTVANENASLSGGSNPFYGRYNDYSNYKNSTGKIIISSLNTADQSTVNSKFVLKEAYPASITPMSFSADSTGYPTFTATFQYNSYSFG